MAEEVNIEQALRDEFKERVKDITLEELPAVINDLMDREHDYGSICVALGVLAAATAWACNKHKNGGITGFQAGAVFWEFARAWGSPQLGETGSRFVNYDNLLYPQYEDSFGTIDRGTLERVRAAAVKKLADLNDDMVATQVVEHWRYLANGGVPFGLRVVG